MVQGSNTVELIGNVPVPRKRRSGVLQFSPFTGRPFYTDRLPSKDGIAKGKLYSEQAAKIFKARNLTMTDDEGNDITEQSIVEFLLEHPSYGQEFIAIGIDGEEVVGRDAYRIPEGDGGVYCRLCKKHFASPQGFEGHALSKAHLAEVEKVEQELLGTPG